MLRILILENNKSWSVTDFLRTQRLQSLAEFPLGSPAGMELLVGLFQIPDCMLAVCYKPDSAKELPWLIHHSLF